MYRFYLLKNSRCLVPLKLMTFTRQLEPSELSNFKINQPEDECKAEEVQESRANSSGLSSDIGECIALYRPTHH